MTFGSPNLLFALLAVPLAALGYRMLETRRAGRSAAWSRRAMLPNIVRRPSGRLGWVPVALFLTGLTFLLVGFARPQRVLGSATEGAPTIVLTFDVSGSMAAADVEPTRLAAARKLAISFLSELPARYRIAVVTFANKVHVVLPPTFDHQQVIARLPTKVTPRSGTAIGDGIGESVSLIVAAAGQSGRGSLVRPGAVLLFSDGAQTAGGTTPRQAAVSALVDYIPIDTIAFGTRKGIVTQPFELNGVQTETQIPVPVQPATLRVLSKQTNGAFYEAASLEPSPTSLSRVYENLNSYSAQGHRTHELSAAAGGLALVFILAGIGLSGLWFGRVA